MGKSQILLVNGWIKNWAVNHRDVGREKGEGSPYISHFHLLTKVGTLAGQQCRELPQHTGHIRGNRQQWKFFKNTNFISSKFIKFYIQWNKLDQFQDDLTAFGALKFEKNDAVFLLFANFNQFREIDVVLFFSSSSDSIFYVGNKAGATWDQKVHQDMLLFLPKTEQKSKIDQNVCRGTY